MSTAKHKHTPGPWKWDKNTLWGSEYEPIHDGKTCNECGHEPTECGDNVLGIACKELESSGENWHPSKADALLIAAAPDLLEALEKLIASYDSEIHNEYDGTAILPARLSEADHARAAIAKALGK